MKNPPDFLSMTRRITPALKTAIIKTNVFQMVDNLFISDTKFIQPVIRTEKIPREIF